MWNLAKMEFIQAKLVVKDPEARRGSNPEVAINCITRTKRNFCQHGANCFTKIIPQRPFGPGIVRPIRSPLLKAFPSVLHRRQGECLRTTYQLKFGVDVFSFQPFKREERIHYLLFHLTA
jgi:hypothetical protein